jgi:hypothetical protein
MGVAAHKFGLRRIDCSTGCGTARGCGGARAAWWCLCSADDHTRPWPMMIWPELVIRTGLVQPNSTMLAAIWATYGCARRRPDWPPAASPRPPACASRRLFPASVCAFEGGLSSGGHMHAISACWGGVPCGWPFPPAVSGRFLVSNGETAGFLKFLNQSLEKPNGARSPPQSPRRKDPGGPGRHRPAQRW